MMSAPIRVLQIVTQMNIGGMESRLMDIYRHIDREKVQFDFYSCRQTPGAFDDEIISLGGKVYYNKPLTVKNLIAIPRRFWSFLNDHRNYLIVHCHLNQWCGLVLAGAMKANVPIRIAHSRTSLKQNSIKNFIKNIIRFPVNYTATHRFAVSDKAAEWLFGKKAVSLGRVQIWPNAINCSKYSYDISTRIRIRDYLNLGDSYTLIHIGNLRPEKNHMFLLQIFKLLKNQIPNCKLLLVGADNLNGSIQEEAQRLSIINDVQFLGLRTDVSELLQAADVFVFPSLYEGFPGAVLEAQASGLPCIISNTITEEVVLSQDVIQLKLDDRNLWVNKIIEFWSFPVNRASTFSQDNLVNSGYDIYQLVNDLLQFYCSVLDMIPNRPIYDPK